MKKINYLLLCICLVSQISCSQNFNAMKTNILIPGSKWTFIEKDIKSDYVYAEMDVIDDQTLMIFSDNDGEIGPIYYEIEDDYFILNKFKFRIKPQNNGSITLDGDSTEFFLYNISFDIDIQDNDQINPFYLRKYYFFVNLNVVLMDEAIDEISKLVPLSSDSIPEEILIISN